MTNTFKTWFAALVSGFCLAGLLGLAQTAQAGGTAASVQHVNAKQAEQLVEAKKVIVLDIRTPKEFKSGRIEGAKNIDFLAPDFEQRLESLDKSKSYLVHCASGGRSSHSLLVFKKLQFQSVYHLDGGLNAWKKGGLPLEK